MAVTGWAAVRAFRRGGDTGSLRRWVRWAAVAVVTVEVIAVAAFLLLTLLIATGALTAIRAG